MSEPQERRLVLELVGDSRAPIELPRAGVLTLGSAASRADMLIEGQGVADVHCAIGRIKGGGWALKDLGSEFGTFVNGERVQSKRLDVGDQLLIGSRRLRVVDPEQATAPAKSAPTPPPPPPKVPEAAPPPPKPAAPAPMPRAAPLSETGVRRANESTGGLATTIAVKGYRVEKPLGRGGMGEVYLAVQTSLDRQVALKVLASKLAADADFVRRFQAEARAAAALNHPNVVTVHDVWEEAGRHFLAMEFMDKGNLETRVAREGKIGAKEALDILGDAARALVYAEMRGIVHRDIKPANLMQNSAGVTKLADLGLATHLEAEATESDNKKIYGTPHFISPEQARGEKVDCRSDLYSLGATVYRLLSGHTPFEGASTRDILRGHFFEQPKPLVELASDVPPDLARIVHRMLEKKPDDRFLSAGVLLQEVERLKSTAHAAPVAPPKKSKTGLMVAGAIGVAVVLFFLFRGKGGDTGPRDSNSNTNAKVEQPPKIETHVDDTPTQPVTPERPRDDDTALKLREAEAQLAKAKLPHELTLIERRDELTRLAKEFAGTTAAEEFQREADELRQEAQRQENALTEHERQVGEALERVRLAGMNGDQPLPLSQAVRAMLAEHCGPELTSDVGFVSRRKQLFVNAVLAARDRVKTDLAEADRLAGTGDFVASEQRLKGWPEDLRLPEMPPDLNNTAMPELNEIDTLRGQVRERLDSMETARAEFIARVLDIDRAKLASTYHAPQGLETELRKLDFAAIDERLAKLEGELETPDAKAFVASQRAGLSAGKKALESLAAEFDKGTWRRKQVIDPRTKSRVNRDALGANAQGVMLKVDNNPDLVPWSAFGGKPIELHQLFEKRLSREYTHDELVGIEALVRTASVLQALGEASEMFTPGQQAVLSDDEKRTMLEGFEFVRSWGLALGSTAEGDREAQAARVLADALQAASTGAWTAVVSGTERLLAEYPNTLLVRFLSDGRGAKPQPVNATQQPAKSDLRASPNQAHDK